jgi:hypothetical protein
MLIVKNGNRSVQSLAQLYVDSKRKRSQPLSTSAAVRAIRTVLSKCTMSDEEIIVLVVRHASAQGIAVEFDNEQRRFTLGSDRSAFASALDKGSPDQPG